MKALIQQYLLDQGVPPEPYSVQFLRFAVKLFKDEQGNWIADFIRWHFPCTKPTFSSQEVEDALKQDYIDSHSDGINNKYASDEVTKQAKLDELNALTDLDSIINYSY